MAAGSAIRAGRAFVELFLDETKLQAGLKSAQARLKAFGTAVTSIGKGMLGVGAAAVTAFVPTIKAASDFEETLSKFNTVFGQNTDAVRAWGEQFGKEVGRSQQQVLSFLANSQDLFVPLGFEPGAATEMSQQLTKLAVDLGSFNNMADEDVLRDLHAALTGSGEVMKKYGVIVSEAAVKQELLNQHLDPSAATDQQKVMARLAIIMRGTTAAQGDALRTADSFANSMKRLRSQVADLAVKIGQALLPILTPLVKQAGEFVDRRLMPWIEANKELIPTLVKTAAKIAVLGGGLIAFGKITSAASSTLSAFSAVMKAAHAGSIGFKAGLAGLAVAGIIAVASAIYRANPAIKEFNRQLEIGAKLSGQLNDREQRRQQNFLADVAVLSTPQAKRGALTDEAQQAQKNIRGLEERVKGAQREVDRLNTTFKSATGNKLLEAAQQELEETQQRLESARRWALDLEDALKDVDRQQQSIANLPTAADLAALGTETLAQNALIESAGTSVVGAAGVRTIESAGGTAEMVDVLEDLIRIVNRIDGRLETALQFG